MPLQNAPGMGKKAQKKAAEEAEKKRKKEEILAKKQREVQERQRQEELAAQREKQEQAQRAEAEVARKNAEFLRAEAEAARKKAAFKKKEKLAAKRAEEARKEAEAKRAVEAKKAAEAKKVEEAARKEDSKRTSPELLSSISPSSGTDADPRHTRWAKVRAAQKFLAIEKKVTSRHPYFYATSVGAAAALCFAVIACSARVFYGTWMRNSLIGAGRFPPSADIAVRLHAALGVLVALTVVIQGYLGSVEERDWHGNLQAGKHRRWHRKFGRAVVLPLLLLLLASSAWVQMLNPDSKGAGLLDFQWAFLLLIAVVVLVGVREAVNRRYDAHRDCMMGAICLVLFAPFIRIGGYIAQLIAGVGDGACDVTEGRVGSQIGTLLALLFTCGAFLTTGRKLPRPCWLIVIPAYFLGVLVAHFVSNFGSGFSAYSLCASRPY